MPIPRTVAVVGAAGQMVRQTVGALSLARPLDELRLIDLDMASLRRTYAERAARRLVQADLNDAGALRLALRGADLVIHAAGPFHRTAAPVREACLALGVDCLDLDDDPESTRQALALHRRAAVCGVGLYVGHGASPGFTSVMAADLIARLDEADHVDLAWCVGDAGGQVLGRAAAEHAVHMAEPGNRAGACGWPAAEVFPMGGELGDCRVYRYARPEPVTLRWSFPQLRAATCWGGLQPQPLNGLLRGVAEAVADGALSMDEACGFLQAVMADKPGGFRPWKHAWRGMRQQVRAGEATEAEFRQFLADSLKGVRRPGRSSLAVRVSGRRNGTRVTLLRQTAPRRERTFLDTMASMTGISAAAFALMILGGPKRSGALPPERWADPETFFALCAQLGPEPLETVVGPVRETEAVHAPA